MTKANERQARTMTFIAATNNTGKITEIRRLVEPYGYKIISLTEANVCLDVEEKFMTYEGNAEIKAFAVCKAADMPAIADDSGLEVYALNNAPGVYSARYSGTTASDLDKINKLFKNLSGVPAEQRTARFVCCICCVFPDGRIIRTRGECEGTISESINNSGGGFGYDPIFIEKQTGLFFSELNGKEKDKLSHRGKAFSCLIEKLKEHEALQEKSEQSLIV
jgi:XTP/dITP diphosphohydrolase